MRNRILYLGIPAIALMALLGSVRTSRSARKPAAEIKIDGDDIGGVVTSSKGPEAGVWVIAETKDLPTGYRKIVVTDDQGRYVVPDLPKANYTVWVRGYGLVDSPKVQTEPGKMLNLTAVLAPDPHEAAKYYPAAYWYSLLHIPPKSDFPGTGPKGNGISERIKDQGEWIETDKDGRLRDLPPIGRQGHARDRTFSRRLRYLGSGLGPAHPVGAGGGLDERQRQPRGPQARSWRNMPTGPIASRPANCRLPRHARKASSATSSLRNGIGPDPRNISMTKFPWTAET